MTAILGRTGNLVGFTTGRGTTPWNTEMEAALRKQDALLATTVQAITNALPASANEGDLFLVGTAPTGVAAGWANRIARWRGSPSGWEAYTPMQGWLITIIGETTDKIRRYNGTAWTPIGNDISMGSVSGLSAALAAKLDADSTGAVQNDVLRLNASGIWVPGKALQVNNPIFTGNLTGSASIIWKLGSESYFSLYGTAAEWGLRNLADDGSIVNYPIVVKRGAAGEVQIGYSGGVRPVRVGGALRFDSTLAQGANVVIDASRNGSFAGLTASGALTANGATAQVWGTGYKPVAVGLGSSIAAKNWPSGDTLYLFNNAYRAAGDVTKAIAGTGNCSALMLQENGGMSFSTVANPGAGATANLVEKFSVDATGAFWLNGTVRITAGGDGRFTSLRAADLVTTERSAIFVDGNGQLTRSAFLRLDPVGGPRFLATIKTSDAFYNGSSGYLYPSLRMLPDVVDESNAPLGLDTGDVWNSKRTNAIAITDGALGAPYIGKLRADRWVGTSLVSISGTTSATSWFAAGSGEGSPTLPTNYLKGGRRVRAKGRVSCQSCAADSAPEFAFKIGSTTIKTQAKAFTIASGNAIYVDYAVDFFADGEGFLVAVGDIKFSSPAVGGTYEYKINYAGAYDGSTAKTIDATIKPSSSAETWSRNLAFIEA